MMNGGFPTRNRHATNERYCIHYLLIQILQTDLIEPLLYNEEWFLDYGNKGSLAYSLVRKYWYDSPALLH